MSELPNSHATTLLAAPDTEIDVRETFGIDIDMKVPAFSRADERVPDRFKHNLRSANNS